MLSDHGGIKLENNNRKRTGKNANIVNKQTKILNNPESKGGIFREFNKKNILN